MYIQKRSQNQEDYLMTNYGNDKEGNNFVQLYRLEFDPKRKKERPS